VFAFVCMEVGERIILHYNEPLLVPLLVTIHDFINLMIFFCALSSLLIVVSSTSATTICILRLHLNHLYTHLYTDPYFILLNRGSRPQLTLGIPPLTFSLDFPVLLPISSLLPFFLSSSAFISSSSMILLATSSATIGLHRCISSAIIDWM
jgi:hypothetical protein